eukprot:4912463-Amphidinium_carterae.1
MSSATTVCREDTHPNRWQDIIECMLSTLRFNVLKRAELTGNLGIDESQHLTGAFGKMYLIPDASGKSSSNSKADARSYPTPMCADKTWEGPIRITGKEGDVHDVRLRRDVTTVLTSHVSDHWSQRPPSLFKKCHTQWASSPNKAFM